MQKLLDTKPGMAMFVVSIEETTTEDGKKVRALTIIGRGPDQQYKDGGFDIKGCPVPPCDPK